jgi:hypothetical protein
MQIKTTEQAKKKAIAMFTANNPGVTFQIKTIDPIATIKYPTGMKSKRATFEFTADGFRPTKMALEIYSLGVSLTKC